MQRTNVRLWGIFTCFSLALLLGPDLLAKFIFSFYFVFPVLWKGLNCHPDGRKPPENPNWGNPRVEKKTFCFFLRKPYQSKHAQGYSCLLVRRSVENSEIRDGKNKKMQA